MKRMVLSYSTVQFDELIRGLAMNGFRMGNELKACFDVVDVDRSEDLEFTEVGQTLIEKLILFMVPF